MRRSSGTERRRLAALTQVAELGALRARVPLAECEIRIAELRGTIEDLQGQRSNLLQSLGSATSRGTPDRQSPVTSAYTVARSEDLRRSIGEHLQRLAALQVEAVQRRRAFGRADARARAMAELSKRKGYRI